uniref:ATP synthase F0 subunit 8 n=1 Tax=Cromna sinensis TaxID=2844952 RepID=A0A8H2SMZ9_9HEMI|nr:ATP synthase F0 subunit 8 [Cromna sinensis]
MPQMSPIMWMTIMILSTTSIYQMKSMIIFESKDIQTKKEKKKMKKKMIKW